MIDYPSMDLIFSEEYSSNNQVKTVRFLDDRPHCLIIGFTSAEFSIVDLSCDGSNKKILKSGRLSVKGPQV